MSSSTSTSASGQCIVCGKSPCHTRCSACLENGIDYIYFCSTEHQRLVWFLHKRVCGIRSSPFRSPALTTEEVEEFQTLYRKPFGINEGGTETWANLMKESNRVPAAFAKLGITEEAYSATSLYLLQENAKNPLLATNQSNQLVAIRSLAWTARIGTKNPTPGELHALIANHPFDWIATVMAKRSSRLSLNPLDDSRNGDWVDEVFHKYLIFIAIIARIHKKPEARSELVGLLEDFAVRFVLNFARLASTGTEEAFELTGYLISTLLKMCGLSDEVLGKDEREGKE